MDAERPFSSAVRAALLFTTAPLFDPFEDTPMLPLPLLLPAWAKYAALAALVAAVWGHGWLTGARQVREDWDAATAAQEAATLARVVALAKRADEITLVYLNQVREVERQARTVEITKYVTAKSNAACPVPVGLVRLWDAAAGVPIRLYQPASGVDDAAADVALADVGRGIVEARRRFEVNRAQCVALQAWARQLSTDP